jgi:RNA polymerase sigma-70 factor (ECF subfamily)
MKTAASEAKFASTLWNVVLAAGHKSTPDARDSLEKLCHTYWYPIYAFLRRQGQNPHDAQDLTQGFFAWLLSTDQLGRADPQRGRFRSFLLCRLKGFLVDEHRKAHAEKRGGHQPPISLDAEVAEERYRLEPLSNLTADKIFERRWAMLVLETAFSRLRQEYIDSGRAKLFEELKDFQSGEKSEGSYAQSAARLGLTESAVKSAIWRLRRRQSELLREEISQTVSGPVELDEEIRHLIAIVGE